MSAASLADGSRTEKIARPYLIAAMLALVGLADAIYLTVEHLTGQSLRCTIVSGCSEVLSSPYSHIGSIPLAAIVRGTLREDEVDQSLLENLAELIQFAKRRLQE